MGVPRSGLLTAIRAAWAYSMTDGIIGITIPHTAILSAKLTVVDVGINDAWVMYGESLGLSRDPVIDFGSHWYIRVYVEQLLAPSDYNNDGGEADDNDDDDG